MSRLLPLLVLVSTSAFASEPSLHNPERIFNVGLSPQTNDTRFFVLGNGRATFAGDNAYRLNGRVDVAFLEAFTVGVGFEYRSSGAQIPDVTAKYQFLRQEGAGVNMAAALKYKLVGLNPNGSEMEGILSASRAFGPLVFMANGIVGTGLSEPDLDVEAVVGVGTVVLDRGFVGLNGQFKALVGEAAQSMAATGGRTTELFGGAVFGYRFAPAIETSLLLGYFSPTGTGPAGPMGLLRFGIGI